MSEQPTNYHESVDHLRRDLMLGYTHWDKVTKEYGGTAGQVRSSAEYAAFAASMMAASYGYTLAAVLGHARTLGPDVAHELASLADDLLTNGDFDGLNADVAPQPSTPS